MAAVPLFGIGKVSYCQKQKLNSGPEQDYGWALYLFSAFILLISTRFST
jgi:hypothetical protein